MTTDDADSNELAAELGNPPWALLLVTAILTYAAAADAFVLSRLWLWYAMPAGLPVLTWKPFVGIVLGFLIMKRVKHGAEPKDERSLTTKVMHFVGYFLVPWIALCVGWVLR